MVGLDDSVGPDTLVKAPCSAAFKGHELWAWSGLVLTTVGSEGSSPHSTDVETEAQRDGDLPVLISVTCQDDSLGMSSTGEQPLGAPEART